MPCATWHIGLTGGIGSGKSSALKVFQQLGGATIDADALAHALTAPEGSAIPAIRQQFGPGFLRPDGSMDRIAMRQWVFQHPSAKAGLEAILHPLIARAMEAAAEDAEAQDSPCIVWDIPLLVESKRWRPRLDAIVVIDCSTSTQQQRVLQRGDLSADDIARIILSQASRLQRLAAADIVLYNDGISFNDFAQHVRQIARQFGL